MLCTDGPALFVSAGAGQLDGVVTGARVNGHIAQEHEAPGGLSVLGKDVFSLKDVHGQGIESTHKLNKYSNIIALQ